VPPFCRIVWLCCRQQCHLLAAIIQQLIPAAGLFYEEEEVRPGSFFGICPQIASSGNFYDSLPVIQAMTNDRTNNDIFLAAKEVNTAVMLCGVCAAAKFDREMMFLLKQDFNVLLGSSYLRRIVTFSDQGAFEDSPNSRPPGARKTILGRLSKLSLSLSHSQVVVLIP
jgi:hypothetical protein